MSASARGRRSIFDSKRALTIDVFYDKLEMCHTIEFTSRLSLDDPTITLADLLLEKLQIVKINQKDIKDVIVLLREHQIGDTEIETVNANYVSDLLSKEWGFYYTATTNLDKIKKALSDYAVLADIDRNDISAKIDRLRDVIESKPKSMRWKMRARIGPTSRGLPASQTPALCHRARPQERSESSYVA